MLKDYRSIFYFIWQALLILACYLLHDAYAENNNETYYIGLNKLTKKDPSEGISIIESWLGEAISSGVDLPTNNDQFKALSTIVLAKLSRDGIDADVDDALQSAICYALPTDEVLRIDTYCDGIDQVQGFGEKENRLLVSMLIAWGTKLWNTHNYPSGLTSYSLAADYTVKATHSKTPGSGLQTDNAALKNFVAAEVSLGAIQNEMVNKMFREGGAPSEESIESKLNSQALKNRMIVSQLSNILCQPSYSSESRELIKSGMLRNNPELAMKIEDINCDSTLDEKTSKEISRSVTEELDIIDTLVKSGMCPTLKDFSKISKNPDASSNEAMLSVIDYSKDYTYKQLAESFEILRGRRSEDLSIVNEDFMYALDKFIAKLSSINERYGTDFFSQIRKDLTNEIGGFANDVSKCIKELDIDSKFTNASMTALRRRERNQSFIERVTLALENLRQFSETVGSTDILQALKEKHALAESQISFDNKEKAIKTIEDLFYLLQNKKNKVITDPFDVSKFYFLKGLELYSSLSISSSQKLNLDKNINFAIENYVSSPHQSISYLNMSAEDIQRIGAKQTNQMVDNSLNQVQIEQQFEQLSQFLGGDASELAKQMNAKFKSQEFIQGMKQATTFAMEMQKDLFDAPVDLWRRKINHSRLSELFLANTFVNLNRLGDAEHWLGEIQDKVKYLNPEVLSYQHYVLARLAKKKNQLREASDYFRKAITQWYFSPKSIEAMFVPFTQEPSWLLSEAIELEYDRGNVERAFEYIEFSRLDRMDNPELYGALPSNALLAYQKYIEQSYQELLLDAKTNARKQGKSRDYNHALAQGEEAVASSLRKDFSPVMPLSNSLSFILHWLDGEKMHNWMWHYDRFNALYFKLEVDAARQLHKDKKIKNAVSKDQLVRILEAQLRGDIFESGLPSFNYYPLGKIKDYIDDSTFILSVMQFRDATYSFGLSSTKIQSRKLDSKKIGDLALAFQKNPTLQSGQKLYDQLLLPYQSQLKDNIVVVANGFLQNIPFSAISHENSYLIDKYRIRYLPYSGLVAKYEKDNSTELRKILIADAGSVARGEAELSHVRDEIRYIEDTFSSSVMQSDKLVKSSFVDALENYQYIHFSGHSELVKDFPDLSYLKLYGDKLHLRDIAKLDLSGLEMIVLASCSSAEQSSMLINNEFTALNAAFMQAGASAVLASLHVVEDKASSQLITKFYEGISKGLRKDEALRQAQLHLKNTYPDKPRLWSSFVFSGNPSSLN